MKPQESEFSPDLTWMLTSGQVGDETLLEAFYQEYYEDISRLCLAALDDKRIAQKATQMVFASAVIDRYRFKDGITIRYWFFQLALETIIKMYNNLEVKRTITANLPIKMKSTNYGDSTPQSSWDAEIWLTLDQLEFEKRLLALSLFYFKWQDAEIISIFNFSPEDLNLNKRYLNSVLLPFRMDKSSNNEVSLEERIIQSLSKRWPSSFTPTIEPDAFIRQVANQIRITRLKNRFSVSSKEFLLTALIIMLAALSIWGYNRYFPEELPATTDPQNELAFLQDTQTATHQQQETQTPQTEEPTKVQDFLYTIRANDSLMSIARQFDVNFYGLRRNNRIPGGVDIQAGQKLWLFVDPTNKEMNLSRFLSKTETKLTQEEFGYLNLPLVRSMGTKIAEGSVMWIEGLIIDYGPDGYVGPPKIEIVQAWYTSEAVLYLVGDEQQKLQEVWLLTEQHQYMATPGLELPWSHAWKPVNPDSQYLESLKLFSDALSRKPTFSPVIIEISSDEYSWNGRGTIAYDIKDNLSVLRERQWIDNETKLLVRRQIFGESDAPIPLKEVNITKIEEGNKAPAGLLDPRIPWRGGFALNYLGQPAPWETSYIQSEQFSGRPRLDPPLEPQSFGQFDFSQAQLTFQYPPIFTSVHRIPVELFADDQFLGTADLGNPWTMICDRSSNGNILAYVSQPGDVPNDASRLQLVDLYNPASEWRILPIDLGVQIFAFSPDGQHLAVFGHPDRYVEGTLLVLDVVEGTYIPLDHLGEASSLVWSPDSQQIAIIARHQSSTFLEEIFVYDLNTGEIASRHPLDFSNSHPAHWPTEEWGIEFPVEMGGLSECAQAPQEFP